MFYGASDGGYLLFELNFSSGEHYYCADSNNVICFEHSQTSAPDSSADAHVTSFPRHHAIGHFSNPEPSSEILLPVMLLGVAFVARKRIKRHGVR